MAGLAIYTTSAYSGKLTKTKKNKSKVIGMQQLIHKDNKQHDTNCAICGKIFRKNEMKVSYDFERFFCIQCDDNR